VRVGQCMFVVMMMMMIMTVMMMAMRMAGELDEPLVEQRCSIMTIISRRWPRGSDRFYPAQCTC
jgi:hypothetical protein